MDTSFYTKPNPSPESAYAVLAHTEDVARIVFADIEKAILCQDDE